MNPHLLTTKFHKPGRRGNLASRFRLLEKLDSGLAEGCRLTLVSAPAGYGKTTLAVDWLAHWQARKKKAGQTQTHTAWLSLDEADDDPIRFFHYFVTALQVLDASIGKDLLSVLEAGQLPPAEVLVADLANGMNTWQEARILVVDDFQFIQTKLILDALSGLLAQQLSFFHLMLLTREDPALPLARLRARGQLAEIRAADLRFSNQESADFLGNGLGLALSDAEIAHLTERTEGWAAGLQLAGLSLQGREYPAVLVDLISGENRFILGYLTEEVLKRLPAETQDFLLQTSILSRLSGDLCDALIDGTNSAARLENLLSANLFLVPLDDEGHWYRYHHLFAELLQAQLRRSGAGKVTDLHNKASAWYETQSMPVEAIEHALAAGDYARVTGLLELSGWTLLNQGYKRKMEVWMKAIPSEQRSRSPRICLDFAWIHLLGGNFDQTAEYTRQAMNALTQATDKSGSNTGKLRAECLTLQANLLQVQGDLSASVEAAQGALALISPERDPRLAGLALLALGGAYRQSADFDLAMNTLQKAARASRESHDWVAWMLATAHLTLMSIHHGRLQFAMETAPHAITEFESLGITPPPIIGALYDALGLAAYEMNQIEQAKKYLAKGIRLGTYFGHNVSVIYNKIHLARLLQAEGDCSAALRVLDEAASLMRAGAPGWAYPDYLYRRVSLLLAMNRMKEAEAELRQSGVNPKDEISRGNDWIQLAWLRLYIFQKDPSAIGLADRILHFCEADQRHGSALQALILGVLGGAGKEWLLRALELAESQGYLRIFVDEGATMARLLREIPPTDFTRKLLGCFPAGSSAPSIRPGELIEALSARELEVLRLLAQGLTYAEIAKRLVLSINTVRYHVKGVYAKLGVEKQAQAVERGQQMGLL